MITVVDSSVLVAAYRVADPIAEAAREAIDEGDLIAPHLIDIEVAQALRRLERVCGDHLAADALRDHSKMVIRRFDHVLLLPRVWELRHNLTAYDAAYVALAEVTGTPLLTLDRRIANAPGHHAEVIVL